MRANRHRLRLIQAKKSEGKKWIIRNLCAHLLVDYLSARRFFCHPFRSDRPHNSNRGLDDEDGSDRKMGTGKYGFAAGILNISVPIFLSCIIFRHSSHSAHSWLFLFARPRYPDGNMSTATPIPAERRRFSICTPPFACLVLSLVALWPSGRASSDEQPKAVTPLAAAHSHNDYLHERPLLDALGHGFTSVEADVFLVQGKLLVAHDVTGLRAERTLAKLYLDPLRERTRNHDGWVFDKGRPLTLLIDIKSDAETTYAALDEVLAKYAEMLTTVADGVLETKAVTVIISGNRPIETISNQKRRYAGIDGRLSDLDSTQPADLLPLISDNWRNHFQWTGEGPLPAGERDKLKEIVRKSHAQGRRVRFWATPERFAVWKVLHAAGVDLINTDDLAGLAKFLNAE
jgi:hypothetical protein